MAGTYRKRGKDTYELAVSAGLGPGGKRKRYFQTVKAKNDRAAEKALAKFITEVELGEYVEPSRLTLEEFSKRWLHDYVDKELSAMTARTYRDKLKDRILPALGHLKMEEIKPMQLLEYFANLEEDGMRKDGKKGGMGPDSIAQCHRVLSSLFKCAVEWQVVRDNPCSRVKPPKIPQRNLKCFDEKQTITMFGALQNEPIELRVLVTLAALTGMRRGEILGLEWNAIDFKQKTASIHQVSQYVKGLGVITKEPKTKASRRLVALPDSMIKLLEKYKVEQNKRRLKKGNKWIDNDRLFTTWNGEPMHPNTPDKWFREFLDRAELPRIRFHDLRHSAATIMIVNGVDVGTVAKNLGHSRPSITTDIYYNAMMTAQERAAKKMDKLFKKSIN